VGGAGFFGVDAADHFGMVVQCLLGLEGALGEGGVTWLPVIPWQMTLVCLLTQTLGTVEKKFFTTLLNMTNKISVSRHINSHIFNNQSIIHT
jgi:hypothetical protein